MCQERADIMHSVKETARKIPCPTGSEAHHTILEKCLIEIITFQESVKVYRQRLGKAAHDLPEHMALELRNEVTQPFLHGHEHNKQ